MSNEDTVDIFGVILEEEKMIFAILILAVIIFIVVLTNAISNACNKTNDTRMSKHTEVYLTTIIKIIKIFWINGFNNWIYYTGHFLDYLITLNIYK